MRYTFPWRKGCVAYGTVGVCMLASPVPEFKLYSLIPLAFSVLFYLKRQSSILLTSESVLYKPECRPQVKIDYNQISDLKWTGTFYPVPFNSFWFLAITTKDGQSFEIPVGVVERSLFLEEFSIKSAQAVPLRPF